MNATKKMWKARVDSFVENAWAIVCAVVSVPLMPLKAVGSWLGDMWHYYADGIVSTVLIILCICALALVMITAKWQDDPVELSKVVEEVKSSECLKSIVDAFVISNPTASLKNKEYSEMKKSCKGKDFSKAYHDAVK